MFEIAAFYKFVPLPDFEELQEPLAIVCRTNDVMGTILLANEGVNGTVAGSADGVAAVLAHLRADTRLIDLVSKHSQTDEPPFLRLKVRVKREIVSLGVGEVDAAGNTGHRVSPEDWNDLIAQDDVLLIDTRNDYEYAVGTFEGAVNPRTRSFTEFPEWLEANRDVVEKPKIAMFCTGGIRCEKASAFLREQGFDDVYQLDGGILRYLEMIPESESAWEGECYVFDRRVSVGHGLVPGDKEICVNCDQVLDEADRLLHGYEPGVTCADCVDTITDDRRSRFRERQLQIVLANERGDAHLGRV